MSDKYVRELFELTFPSLEFDFIKLMSEIGDYGRQKYGEQSFDIARRNGTLTRSMDRVQTLEIGKHIQEHYKEAYLEIPHDHFGTVDHQLAAAAFNVMMEFIYRSTDK